MKSRICTALLVIILSVSLSACSTDKTDPATTDSVGTGSSQITIAPTRGSADGTSSPEDENSLPADIYKAVLQDEVSFISTDVSEEFFLDDFLARNSEYAGVYDATRFAVCDMDGDNTPEVILELSLNNYPEQYEILHYSDGTVYGYDFVYRGFEDLKEDGTYRYSNSASDGGVQKILSFRADSVETETLGYSQSDYSGGNMEISYFIDNVSVTKEAFNAFFDRQDEKNDVQWYELSAENIEALNF